MTKILFICKYNRGRSLAAERIYASHPGLEVASAGIDFFQARILVSEELLQWADVILCMEEWHQKAIEDEFAACIKDKVIDSLGVTQDLRPGLVDRIKEKVDAWLNEYQKGKLSRDAKSGK